jgi:hypothetical protein
MILNRSDDLARSRVAEIPESPLRFAEYCDTQMDCHSERSEESALGWV